MNLSYSLHHDQSVPCSPSKLSNYRPNSLNALSLIAQYQNRTWLLAFLSSRPLLQTLNSTITIVAFKRIRLSLMMCNCLQNNQNNQTA